MSPPSHEKNSHTTLVTTPDLAAMASDQHDLLLHNTESREHNSDADQDFDLKSAIGDAFSQIGLFADPDKLNEAPVIQTTDTTTTPSAHASQEHVPEQQNDLETNANVEDPANPSIENNKEADEADHSLNTDISDSAAASVLEQMLQAWREASQEPSSQNQSSETSLDSEVLPGKDIPDNSGLNPSHPQTQDDNHEDLGAELDNIIEDAVKNLATELGGPVTTQSPSVEPESQYSMLGSHADQNEQLDNDDVSESALEDAIGNAFKSLAEDNSQLTHLATSISQESSTAPGAGVEVESSSTDVIDPDLSLASIVQNVVQQMKTDASAPKTLPSIDENVLAHFQSQANTDEDPDAALKSAVASAVTKAMSSQANPDDAEKELDLEKLHMNEILQNAFDMAMHNSTELVSKTTSHQPAEQSDPYRRPSISTAIALAVKEATKSAEAPKDETQEASKKPLSIAETLALHRDSIPGKRDYSSIEALELVRSDLSSVQHTAQSHPQLSSILSSISHHIQSGNQSQNIMQVIRQMTNALVNKIPSVSVSSGLQEVVLAVKSLQKELQFFLRSLQLTKDFLSSFDSSEASAQLSVTNAMALLDPRAADPNTISDSSSLDPEMLAGFTACYETAMEALSSYDSTRFHSSANGIKRDLESSEYKNRVRDGNRVRKKKWREDNVERNKDNDLRGRVIRRAMHIFGEGDSEEKKAWIEEEFVKRRDKRLAKQKKEEAKSDHNKMMSELMVEDQKPELLSLSAESLFAKRIGHAFNLVAECGSEDDPKAILMASAAASAVTAFYHASDHGITDLKQVTVALSQTLGSVLDTSLRSGGFRRISVLVKHFYPTSTSATSPSQSFGLVLGGLLHLPSQSNYIPVYKRTDDLSKRQKLESDDMQRLIDDHHNERDRSSGNTSSSHSWIGSLKMPSYMRPGTSTLGSKAFAGPSTASSKQISPFISNRAVGSQPPIIQSGLRKPGSFQRPAFLKPVSKPKNEYPVLYSNLFSHT